MNVLAITMPSISFHKFPLFQKIIPRKSNISDRSKSVAYAKGSRKTKLTKSE